MGNKFLVDSYKLISRVRKPLEKYRNALTIMNELIEKGYKIYTLCIVNNKSSQI